MRIQLNGLVRPGGRTPHLTVWDVAGKRSVFDTDVVAAEDAPIVAEFVTAAPQLQLMNEVPARVDEGGVHPGASGFFLTTRDHRLRHPRARKLIDDDGVTLVPLLLIDWVEIESPVVTEQERQARDGLFPADQADESQVRDCLSSFCERAWRRPVAAAEVVRYPRIAAGERAGCTSARCSGPIWSGCFPTAARSPARKPSSDCWPPTSTPSPSPLRGSSPPSRCGGRSPSMMPMRSPRSPPPVGATGTGCGI